MKTSNAVEIMHKRYIKGNKRRLWYIKWEKLKTKVWSFVYQLWDT